MLKGGEKASVIVDARVLDKALQRPKLTLIIAGAIFIGSTQLFPLIGFRLFPPTEKPQFVNNTTITPLQTNLEQTDSVASYVERILSETDHVKYFASNSGKGNPRIYYNFFPENIGGLLPIALSVNPLISPLAIVLIGGLISSTLLSRIVTPVVYKLIPPKI